MGCFFAGFFLRLISAVMTVAGASAVHGSFGALQVVESCVPRGASGHGVRHVGDVGAEVTATGASELPVQGPSARQEIQRRPVTALREQVGRVRTSISGGIDLYPALDAPTTRCTLTARSQ